MGGYEFINYLNTSRRVQGLKRKDDIVVTMRFAFGWSISNNRYGTTCERLKESCCKDVLYSRIYPCVKDRSRSQFI